jgi:hypothetical protein
VDKKSNEERSAEKIARAPKKQPFQWAQNLASGIVGGIVVGLVVLFVQGYLHQKALEQNVAKTIAVVVANDTSISAIVSEFTRQHILKQEFKDNPVGFEAVYSPTVELPSASEVASLKFEVISALDEYKRRLSECSKHRKIYLSELRSGAKQNALEAALVTYCVSLDSVVLTGIELAEKLQKNYPSTQGIFEKLPIDYRPIQEDMPQIQEILNKTQNG